MKRRRIYVDTSVIGGCLDEEFQDASRRLFDRFESGEDVLVVSELTLEELRMAPDPVRAVFEGVDDRFVEELEFTLEAARLAEEYIASGVVVETKRIDAQHVATVHAVDVVVSWNFKHLVNLDRIHGYNSVNLRSGYTLLEIRTPREVLPYGEE